MGAICKEVSSEGFRFTRGVIVIDSVTKEELDWSGCCYSDKGCPFNSFSGCKTCSKWGVSRYSYVCPICNKTSVWHCGYGEGVVIKSNSYVSKYGVTPQYAKIVTESFKEDNAISWIHF